MAQNGFTLVELLVSLTLGLLLVAGLGWVFLNSSRTNAELGKMNRQMENGRFAIYQLKDDLQHAGFWGELTNLPNPVGLVDPCKNYTVWSNSDKTSVLALPVQGYADGAGLPATCATPLSNRKTGTDVLVVRHVATCMPGTTDCAAAQMALQVSVCGTDPIPWVMDVPGASAFTLRRPDSMGRPCSHPSYVHTPALQRRVIANTYFIRDYAKAVGDGIPTLMVLEPDAAGAASPVPRPLVEGIDMLRVEYGIDNAGNDGVPDGYVTAASVTDWRHVVAVRLYVIARNLETTPGYTDEKTYPLPGGSAGPFNDAFKRHAYLLTVRLNNVAGRRAP